MLTAMDDTPPRAVWIDRFVMHTRALGVRAEPELIEAMAAALWPTPGHMQPEAAAQAEYDERLLMKPTEFRRTVYARRISSARGAGSATTT
jgi:hypothetical protein